MLLVPHRLFSQTTQNSTHCCIVNFKVECERLPTLMCTPLPDRSVGIIGRKAVRWIEQFSIWIVLYPDKHVIDDETHESIVRMLFVLKNVTFPLVYS